MSHIIHKIIFINGLYDIVCAFSILIPYDVPIFSKIHINMFKNNDLHNPCLAYWIFTYGFMRLYSIKTAFYSYIFEALFFLIELYNDNIYANKGLFVILSSLFLACCALYVI